MIERIKVFLAKECIDWRNIGSSYRVGEAIIV